MVFTSLINFVRARGPDEFWRKRRIFKLAAHYRGRTRNCYGLAIRSVNRALVYATKGRKLGRQDLKSLHEQRVQAGCEEHGTTFPILKESLLRNGIQLNRCMLADLACWEPYSFKALTDVAKRQAENDGLNEIYEKRLKNTFKRGINK